MIERLSTRAVILTFLLWIRLVFEVHVGGRCAVIITLYLRFSDTPHVLLSPSAIPTPQSSGKGK